MNLKPCPFCGHPPMDNYNDDGVRQIYCENPDCGVVVHTCIDEKDPFSTWNMRHDFSAQGEESCLMF